jgi:RNA polymerase sigma factor (sigma-70 family)
MPAVLIPGGHDHATTRARPTSPPVPSVAPGLADHELIQRARVGDAAAFETMTSRQPDPERRSGNGKLRRSLEDAIDALPDDFRTVFVLRAVEGMSIDETANALSMRPETVKTRFHRARIRLQDTLGARFEALMPAAFEFGGERCDRIVKAVLALTQR